MSTITDLYSRDPFDLTDRDLDAIIEDLREKRKNFKIVGVPAKSSQRTPPKADPALQGEIEL
jgi:hypothetical protein